METYVLSSTGKPVISKDPNATLDYSVDWTDWMPAGDEITALTVIAETPLVVVSSGFESSLVDLIAHTTSAFISGGVVGVQYSLTFRITTAGGRIDDRTVYLKIKER